jgi:hypothetical protein
METPYENGLLVALVLQPPTTLRFIRTGVHGAREARMEVAELMRHEHWVILLAWDSDELRLSAQPAPRAPA